MPTKLKKLLIWPFLVIFFPQFPSRRNCCVGNKENALNNWEILFSRFVFPRQKSKILFSILSSQNKLENKIRLKLFQWFSPTFVRPETSFRILENHQIFSKCSTPCMFLQRKIWNYIIGPKNLLENWKMSKNDNFQSLSSILGGLKLFVEILKNHQIFSSCSNPRIFYSQKSLRW